MANGAGRIFDVLKNTAEEVSSVGSQYVTLEVISINPLKLKLGDKLEITEEFIAVSSTFNPEVLSIGSKVNALVLNNSQLFYILGNTSFIQVVDNLSSTDSTKALSANQGRILNNKFSSYLPLTGGTLTGNLFLEGNKIHFGNGGNVEWKENGYGDKFRIIPNFNGADDDNTLKIQGTVGGAGEDPIDWADIGTISAKNRKCLV